MAIVKKINEESFWLDPQGRLIPAPSIKAEDQTRDELVEKIAQCWKECQNKLIELKDWVYKEVGAYLELMHSQYGAKVAAGTDCNLTIRDFSGCYKLQIRLAEVIGFDDKLVVAKSLIDQCLERWSVGAEPKLVTVINDAFRVNQQGKISIPRILGLRKLPIEDETWQKAMEAITDSVIVEHTKKYVRLYEKTGPEGKYTALPLDIAAL